MSMPRNDVFLTSAAWQRARRAARAFALLDAPLASAGIVNVAVARLQMPPWLSLKSKAIFTARPARKFCLERPIPVGVRHVEQIKACVLSPLGEIGRRQRVVLMRNLEET